MKIGICDDSPRDKALLKTALLSVICNYDTLECFEHGAALLESHEAKPFDILFLDIGMPNLNGIDVAKEVRSTSQLTHIIFVTQYRDYAAESYAVKAFSYLNKPVERNQLQEVFRQARNSRLEDGKCLGFIIDYDMVYVRTSAIIYAETLRNKIRVHTYDKVFDTRMTMRELSRQLDGYGFYRLHTSYLINLNCVRSIQHKTVTLESGVEIPVGKTIRVNEIKSSILSWRRG
ncbi:MAG: LytR/AlgR family response regulator transcription factor [Lachnospiraceae bacterium]